MRLRGSALFLSFTILSAAPRFTFSATSENGNPWPTILSSIGLVPSPPAGAGIVVVPRGANWPVAEWQARVEQGTILVLEGASPLANAFGFKPNPQAKNVAAQSIEDLRSPELRIIWERPVDTVAFAIPANAQVFARERHQQIPLLAGYRRGAGAVLWMAVGPGERGYERFPYLPQALTDLGLDPPFRSGRLWVFFDSAYRSRVDLDYFARRWRAAGMGALHVAAWHYWERGAQNDEYLRQLIDACHRNAIQVYAWLELPHVSEQFWDGHPEWREKTAALQDARLDWRKLVNLTNRGAFQAVSQGVNDLVNRFDWDGVNLAELYFESLEGVDNPARLTPMNDDVRAEFRGVAGFDPLELFNAQSPRFWGKNAEGLKRFLDFRADLARRQQTEWIAQLENIRKTKTHLDLVLTHIDDRFDPSMREKLGADATRVLPLLGTHDFTFLIEDPATIWNLGPQRYPQIASRYAPLTPAQEKLAIDVNVVERYQDVYPTKLQTGAELFQLVHTAALAFPRVALYFENSIGKQDLSLLSSSAALVDKVDQSASKWVIDSKRGAGVPWNVPAQVDGKSWPFASDTTVWLPKGSHTIERAAQPAPLRVLDFNGDLRTAKATASGAEFSYQSGARAMAVLEKKPVKLEIDGLPATPEMAGNVLLLPKGQHLVAVE